MKRPSGLALGVIAGIVALVVTEVIVWWPDAPKKRSEEPPPAPTPVAIPNVPEPVLVPTMIPSAPPVHSALTIRQLKANENDEIRRLEGCSDKHCGDPCIFRCDPNEDGRCTGGMRPGACTVDGVCSTTLPAVCPTPGEPPP
jgi:hypothetical protein